MVWRTVEEWPFVGRTLELGRISDLIATGRSLGVVLVGQSGVGLTRLAREAVGAAAAAGLATEWVACTEPLVNIRFGGFAGTLPTVDFQAEPIDLLRLIVQQLRAAAGDRRLLVAIDSAHLIDDGSAGVVHQLSTPGAFVLATASGRGAGGFAQARLFPFGGVEQLAVLPLQRGEVRQLLRTVLGGPVEGLTVDRLWRATGGLPLLLHELVRGGLDEGSLTSHDGLWVWRGPDTTATAVAAVEARLAPLPAGEREALALIAVAEPASVAVVEAVVDRAAIESLDRRELIVVERSGRRCYLRVAQALLGDVIRSQLSAWQRRSLNARLHKALESVGGRRKRDVVESSQAALDAGVYPAPSRLVRAAELARGEGTTDLARNLASAALATGADGEAAHILGWALAVEGDYDSAAEMLAVSLVEQPDPDAALDLAALLFWAQGRTDEARRMLRHVPDGPERDAALAAFHLYEGHPQEALAPAAAIDPATAPARAAARAKLTAAVSLALTGKPDEAPDLVATAKKLFHGPLNPAPGNDEWIVAEVLPLLLAGRIREAMSAAVGLYESALAAADPSSAALAAAFVGRVHLAAGRAEQADGWTHEALLELGARNRSGFLSWCLATRAHALALLGDQPAATAALAEASGHALSSNRLLEVDSTLARAWVAAGRGERSEAVRWASDAAATARQRGQHLLALLAWHDVARLGSASLAAERAMSQHGETSGRLAELLPRHIVALAADDAVAIAECAGTFEEVGADLLAAEAAATAAGAYRRTGRHGKARVLLLRARQLLGRCRGVRTPALWGLGETPTLTARQREVAFLAAGGISSREIAARLKVSSRTVDNHLQHIYRKLGLSRRADLAEALRPLAVEETVGSTGHANDGAALAHVLDAAGGANTQRYP